MDARHILRKAGSAAVSTDAHNRIRALNRSCRELLGLGPRDAVRGKNLFKLLKARDVYGNRLTDEPLDFWEQLTRGEEIRGFELSAREASGRFVRLSVGVILVLGAEPSHFELVYMLRPLLRRRKADEAIERILSNPRHGGLGFFASVGNGDGNGSDPEVPLLTERQSAVLRELSKGKSAHEIAKELGVSVYTVRSHLRNIFDKLGVHTQAEAVARAFQGRLL